MSDESAGRCVPNWTRPANLLHRPSVFSLAITTVFVLERRACDPVKVAAVGSTPPGHPESLSRKRPWSLECGGGTRLCEGRRPGSTPGGDIHLGTVRVSD